MPVWVAPMATSDSHTPTTGPMNEATSNQRKLRRS